MNMTLADELFYTAVNLHRVRGGAGVGTGTGFFWTTTLANEKEATFLVTNKHVLEGCDQISAVCHEADVSTGQPKGTFATCVIDITPDAVVNHPNPIIDLCAVPFGPTQNQALNAGSSLFTKSIRSDSVPNDKQWSDFDSIEEVVMIGCPRGIYDDVNNLPIVRRGITATPLHKRYGGRDEFMVDMACFPGSSGSPVFMMSRGHMDRASNTYMIGAGRFFFLGVLYSGPLITNEGQVVLSSQPRVEVAAMMHLGQVIRSSAVLQMEDELVRCFNLQR